MFSQFDFMLFVSYYPWVVTQHSCSFWWKLDLNTMSELCNKIIIIFLFIRNICDTPVTIHCVCLLKEQKYIILKEIWQNDIQITFLK